MQKQMHMSIDETRQQRAIAEGDELSARWMRNGRTHSNNAVTFDQNLPRRKHAACVDLEQAGRVQNDRMRGTLLQGRLRVRGQCERRTERERCDPTHSVSLRGKRNNRVSPGHFNFSRMIFMACERRVTPRGRSRAVWCAFRTHTA